MLMNDLKFPMLLTNAVGVIVCALDKGNKVNSIRGKVLKSCGNACYQDGEVFEGFSIRYFSPYPDSIYINGVSLRNV